MQQNREDPRHEIQQLEKQIEQLTSLHQEEKYSYNQRINELCSKIQQIETARSSLVQELQNAQSVCSSLEADNASLRQRLNEANNQLSTSELEILKFQSRFEEVARQQREMANCFEKVKEVIELTNVKNEQRQILHNLKQEMESLDSQIAQNIERVSENRAEVEEQQNVKLAEKVNQLNDDTSKINSLPDEVIVKIFSYLKQNRLGHIARVCRRWNVLTRRQVLWKKVNVKFSDVNIQIFPPHRSPTAITKSFINRLPSCVTSIRLNFDNSHEKLDFVEFCESLQKSCPHLEELIVTYCKFSCSFSSVMDLCAHFLQGLKKLVFFYCIFSNCRPVGECSGISKIESLDAFYCKPDNNGSLCKPSFSKMPHLRRLKLCGSEIDHSWFEGDTSFLSQLHMLYLRRTKIFPAYFPVRLNHGLNLKELCLFGASFRISNNLVPPQLVTICLVCCYVTSEDVVSLLQSCQYLQNVYVDEDLAKSLEVHSFFVANRYRSGIVKESYCNHDDGAESYVRYLCFCK